MPLPLLLSLCGLLMLAGISDLRRRRLPNALCYGGIVVALLLQAGLRGGSGVADALGGLLLASAPLLPLYWRGGFAAGDLKLLAAVGAHLGVVAGLLALAVTLIAGALAAVCMLLLYRRRPRSAPLAFAYAPAIAVGGVLAAGAIQTGLIAA